MHYRDKKLTFEKLAYMHRNAAELRIENLYFVLQQLWGKTFLKNQEHAVTFQIFVFNCNLGKILKGKKPV